MSKKLYYSDTYHHVYNRGTLQTKIFFDEEDFQFFLNRLKKFSERYQVKVIVYCLLNNHFHLFVKQTNDKLTIGKFIGDLLNAYTKFINKKYNRIGVLFESPAKVKFINEKIYFKWIIEYILLNPVKAKLVCKATEWKYSSAYELLNVSNNLITSLDELKTIYGTKENLMSEINNLSLTTENDINLDSLEASQP
jgi:REP element-mobilizing transposase RayT